MKSLLRALIACFVVGALLAPALATAATPNLAVVNLQKVLFSTKAGKAAKAKFEAMQKKKKKQLKRRDNELKKQEKELAQEKIRLGQELAKANPAKISPVLRAKAQTFEAKVRQFQQEVIEFQKTQRDALQQLAKKEATLLKPIEDKIKTHISDIAKAKGYVMVLNGVTVVYHVPSVDITDEVIKRMGK